MTDEIIDALGYLRRLSKEWTDDRLSMSASYIADVADTLEAELRKCRAETLREAERIAIGIGEVKPAFAVDVAFKLRRMADEAELEANNDA